MNKYFKESHLTTGHTEGIVGTSTGISHLKVADVILYLNYEARLEVVILKLVNILRMTLHIKLTKAVQGENVKREKNQ